MGKATEFPKKKPREKQPPNGVGMGRGWGDPGIYPRGGFGVTWNLSMCGFWDHLEFPHLDFWDLLEFIHVDFWDHLEFPHADFWDHLEFIHVDFGISWNSLMWILGSPGISLCGFWDHLEFIHVDFGITWNFPIWIFGIPWNLFVWRFWGHLEFPRSGFWDPK